MKPGDVFFIFAVITAGLASVMGLYWFMEGRYGPPEWQEFVKEHNCKPLAKTETITTYQASASVGPDGAMHPSIRTTTIQGEQAFLCDDGVIYWR